ncbi:MAG TPA: hypothetical protein VGS19_04650 [Streptosporangiaceae bacterium]|nr:hypothetical protein [Streptosporangiaceae bacterium]
MASTHGGVTRPACAVVALALVTGAAMVSGGNASAASGPRSAVPGTISTIAGGVGGPGLATRIGMGANGVSYAHGSLYVAALNTIRRINTVTDQLSTPAGNGGFFRSGNGGLAADAGLNTNMVAADHSGNLVLTDTGDNQVRVVAARSGRFYGQPMTAGHIYRVAGSGEQVPEGVPATQAKLYAPYGVAVDAAGNVLIAVPGYSRKNLDGDRVCVVAESTGTFYGQQMKAGYIYSVAGNGMYGFSGDAGPAAAARLGRPAGVGLDAAGNVLIADTFNDRVRVVAEHTGTFYGRSMTGGDIYTIAGGGTGGLGDGGPATAAELLGPYAVAVDSAGNLVVSDTAHSRVRVVAEHTGTFYGQSMTGGDIYTVAGDGNIGFSGNGGPATSAELAGPYWTAEDGAGNLVVADGFDVRVVAAHTGTFYRQQMTAGDIYQVAGRGIDSFYSGDGGRATAAQLFEPAWVTVDHDGNFVVCDCNNNRVRVVAEHTGTFYGRSMRSGDIYTVAGNGGQGSLGEDGPATKVAVSPSSVAVDGAGNLLVGEGKFSNRVRVVAGHTGTYYGQQMTRGDIYTIAGNGQQGSSGDGGPAVHAELDSMSGLAVDAGGNVLIADTLNLRVRLVAVKTGTFYGQAMTAGNIYTVAGNGRQGFSGDGGPATHAKLNLPSGSAVDAAGNVLFADGANARVRVVAAQTGTFYGQSMTAGDVYTVAGGGTGGLGLGGPATGAELADPSNVTLDAVGNLVINDSGVLFDSGARVEVVAAHTGTFYGQAMTEGDIYSVAGNGVVGFSGDGGPAGQAELGMPANVSLDAAGDLLIADSLNNRVRLVTAWPPSP